MALPQQLKSARMTNDTLGVNIDDNVGDLEKAICDILGLTVDSDVTASALGLSNAGKITKTLLEQVAAGSCGHRFRDSGSGKEFCLYISGSDLFIAENTNTESSPVWTDRCYMTLSTGVWHFNAIPVGPSSNPTADNELARKKYVDDEIDTLDAAVVHDTGAESIDGVKTFGSFPVTPSSAPTTDYQVANKKYVNDQIDAASFSTPYAQLQDQKSAGTVGGASTSATWHTRTLNTEVSDADGIVGLSSNQFTLQAGTYRISAKAPAYNAAGHKLALYNVSDTGNEIIGLNANTPTTGANVQTHAFLDGVFTISGEKTFELRHYIAHGEATSGLGLAINASVIEIYAQVELWKIA